MSTVVCPTPNVSGLAVTPLKATPKPRTRRVKTAPKRIR